MEAKLREVYELNEIISFASQGFGTTVLEIKDSVGCILGGGAGVPQIIEVKGSAENFEVKGGLDDPNTVGIVEELKSLPPDCDSATENGKISLEVTGGQLPYQINWYIEDLSTVSATVSGSTSNIVGYKLLSQYQNQLNLNNLTPGNYKVIINSQNTSTSCGTQKNNSTYLIIEDKHEVLLPPTVTKVPALLLLHKGHHVIFGGDIFKYFAKFFR